MPKVTHRPDLVSLGCRQLTAATTFRLGRKRLAEDSSLSTRQLLVQPNTFSEKYAEGGKEHELVATLTLLQRVDGGADHWSLELAASSPGRGLTRKPDSSKRPSALLGLLGKLGLETDFYVQALFVRPVHPPWLPKLPVQKDYGGGGFSHIVGYTLAKVGELDQVLYELNVRWLGGNSYGLGVGFTYRRTLDEAIYEQMLKRATELVDSVLANPEDAVPQQAPDQQSPAVVPGDANASN